MNIRRISLTAYLFTLTVLTGVAPAQDKQMVKDPPPPLASANLELTVYLVSGLGQSQPATRNDIPPDLVTTLQQLRSVFAYKSYRLIEALTLRGRNNCAAEVSGALPDSSFYDFKYARALITLTPRRMVRLDSLRLELTRHHFDNIVPVALVSTDLDLQDGQKTVVGRSAVTSSDALFLVIVPKIIEY
jgi:hypothetical protein